MIGALSGEWTKLSTTRAPWWTAFVALLGIGGIGVTIAAVANEGARPIDLLGGASLGLMVVMVLATLAATSDHTTGTHRLALMADSGRVRLFVAKAVVVSVVCAVLGALGAGIVSLAAFGSPKVVDEWTGDDIRSTVGQIAVWALAGLLAVSVGTIVRRTALAVAVVVVWPVVVEPMIQLIPKVGANISEWLPFNNSVMFTTPALLPPESSHGPILGLVVFAAYAVVLAVVAAVVETRRDA